MSGKRWANFRKIRRAIRFEQVLERYGMEVRRRNGAELTCHCPFHNDTNPSLQVNTQKQVFYCFGCGAKGDFLDFVSEKERVSVKEAAILLSEWFGIGEKTEKQPAAIPSQRKTLAEPQMADCPQKQGNRPLNFKLQLCQDHPYLKERRLDRETIEMFGLGYCSYGLMKGRIAIPIHDEEGRLIAYASRWPGKKIPDGESKYKLPSGFKKSQVLFNLHRVQSTKRLVIVEGYWSVFRLHKLGIHAVALMGTTLSEHQESLLLRSKVRHLLLMLDGDEPGRQAQAKILPRLALHLFVKSVSLPAGEQPDTVDEPALFQLLQD